MARTGIDDFEKFVAKKKATLEYYIFIRKVDDRVLARVLGITLQTFKTKRKNPGMFKVSEICKLNAYLQIPNEELL